MAYKENPSAKARPAWSAIGQPGDLRGHFDEAFYLTAHPEVAGSGIDPITHYWREGWRKGFDPTPDFATDFYLRTYPDVAHSDFNPFWHYVRIGRAEGRLPRPPATTSARAGTRPAAALATRADAARRQPGRPEDLRAHFDAPFYLKAHPEVAESGIDPLTHYWREGWRKGFDPAPGFSTAFYLGAYPDVAHSDFNPFWHYVRIGKAEGRLPRPPAAGHTAKGAAAPAPARKEAASAAPTAERQRMPGKPADIAPHFDEAFYLKAHPEVAESGLDPLVHYWREGWREGFDPAPDFCTTYYLGAYPDIAKSDFNPFWHYVRIGKAEGRRGRPPASPRAAASPSSPAPKPSAPPAPAPASAATPEPAASPAPADEAASETVTIEAKAPAAEASKAPAANAKPVGGNMADIRDHFDADFYLKTYPEVADSGLDPLTHYWTVGWAEGHDPNADFSTADYLALNEDVAKSGVHPFWHYVVAGKAEGRPARAPKTPEPVAAAAPAGSDMDVIRPHFDPVFYTARYPDIAKAGIDPLTHYWASGWREGRDPAPDFSTRFYLENHADVAKAGINPFWHYIIKGKAEGRRARHPGGPRVDRLRVNKPLEQRVEGWRKAQPVGELLPGRAVAKRIARALAGKNRLIVSIGHDRYWKHSGGVQLCIHREERLADEAGSAYLFIHPVQALPRLAHMDEADDLAVGFAVNGRPLGIGHISDIIAAVAAARETIGDGEVVIHHMLGHQPERLRELIAAAGAKSCYFWLHDFLAVCPGYTLQRNDVAFCAAPPRTSNACTLCAYGRERLAHLTRIESFFAAVDVHLLAPSEVALKVFARTASVTPASSRVVPHMTLTFDRRQTPLADEAERPMTIGFLGTPAAHKGWEVFDTLMRRRRASGAAPARFVFCGTAEVPASGIERVPVHVNAERREAMIEAVAEEKIDFVLHFASWPETFSLSTFEALAGGAFVLTNPLSGNVAATVKATGRGAVLKDEADLYAFFEDGRAEELLATARATRRATHARHTLSRMTFEHLAPRTALEETGS